MRIPKPIESCGKRALSRAMGWYRTQKYLVRDLGKYNIAKPKGRCLVSYFSGFVQHLNQHRQVGPRGWDPHTLPEKINTLSRPFSRHTMYWESAEIVRQFIERGYVVDCIYDRKGEVIRDASRYDVILDEWTNMPTWAEANPKAKKLFYTTGCHWLFHNTAELTRIQWLFQRRGVEVPPGRQIPPLLGLEEADLITSLGNRYVFETFGAFAPKIRKLWISAVNSNIQLRPKDWNSAGRRFVYFSGGGWVHKGLDLTVEAFLKEPSLSLVICGGGGDDPYFEKIYGPEIRKAPNIEVRNHVDSLSEEFLDLCHRCVGVVSPSGSEGCSGAAVQMIHAGLLPVVTPHTGLVVQEGWPVLEATSDSRLIEGIRNRCREISEMSEPELETWRRFFWEFARENHTRTGYRRSLGKILDELLKPAP